MREYTDLEVLQMIGRAGRPQFDTLGVGTSRSGSNVSAAMPRADFGHLAAVIMTEKGSESKYSDLVNAQVSHRARFASPRRAADTCSCTDPLFAYSPMFPHTDAT